jgi:hypothetical protein
MSKVIKKVGGALVNPVLGQFGYGFDKLTGVKAGKDAPVTAIPDFEEVLRKQRKKMARKPKKGRASTVLTDYEYMGEY